MRVVVLSSTVENYNEVSEAQLIQFKNRYIDYDTKVFVEYMDGKPEIVIAFKE